MWVANGTSVQGYSSSGTAVSGALVNAPTGGDFFSLATTGSSGTSEDVFIADSGNQTLTEYSWNGSAMAKVGTTFSFTNDPSAGGISPQEIALGAGSVWTTSFDGQIVKYNDSTGAATIVQNAGGALTNARGIMVDGSTVYVTVQGYGSGSVYDMSTSATTSTTPTLYASLGSSSVDSGAYATGQMRGITFDAAGSIFYDDSTWAPSGQNFGYIDQNSGTNKNTTVLSSLAGPNELESGDGTAGSGDLSSGCNVVYIANYYGGTVEEVSTGDNTFGFSSSSCGSGTFNGAHTDFLSGLTDASGIALSPSEGGLGGNEDPTFLSSPAPEPSSGALMLSALLLTMGMGIARKKATTTGDRC